MGQMRHTADSVLAMVSLVVLLASAMECSAQSLRVDFSPPIVERLALLGEKAVARPAGAGLLRRRPGPLPWAADRAALTPVRETVGSRVS